MSNAFLEGLFQNNAISKDVMLALSEQIDYEAMETVFIDGSLMDEDSQMALMEEYAAVELFESSENLRHFEVLNMPFVTIMGFEAFPKLETLIANHAELSCFLVECDAPALKHLSLVDNKLHHAHGIGGSELEFPQVTQLEHLAVSANPKLKHLDFESKSTVKVLRLRQLPQFQFSQVQEFTQLEELHIDLYKYANAQYFPPTLRELKLTAKGSSTFKHLPELPELQSLSITRSEKLKVIELPHLPQLETLDISHNALIKLPDFDHTPKLKTLIAKGNVLKDLTPLEALKERGVNVEL